MGGRRTCPACGGATIISADDPVHMVNVLVCDECGEMYAVQEDDLVDAFMDSDNPDIAIDAIFHEWHESYRGQKRIGDGQI